METNESSSPYNKERKLKDLVFACVGKPSAGKSTLLNAVAPAANAKVGNYPFTTIEPNHGVAFYRTECPCVKHGLTAQCSPRYGKCNNGTRLIPVKVLDVAGLVPGAHEGRGLGNKFLHDLSTADLLLHVVDASGTVDENGRGTDGYNPVKDIEWLREEIELWIFNNLYSKWGSVVRRHTATKCTPDLTLHSQLSGYSTQLVSVQNTLQNMRLEDPMDKLENWNESMVRTFVNAFVEERFPIILALNKIDMKDAAKNIANICQKYGEDRVVLVSALAECFLLQMRKKKYILYNEGDDDFVMFGEEKDADPTKYDTSVPLVKPPPAMLTTLEKTRDMVLFRYGSTGCVELINIVIKTRGFFPVYVVDSLTKFTPYDGSGGVFRDVVLIPRGYSLRQVAKAFDIPGTVLFGHGTDGIQIGPDQVITQENNILKIITQD